MLVTGRGQATSSQPLPAGKPLSSKWPLLPACAKPSSGTDCTVRAVSPINCTKVSMELLVAASALATEFRRRASVRGRRGDALGFVEGAVGSRPARLASSPQADSPEALGKPIQRGQIWPWVSMRGVFGCLAIGSTSPKS